MITEQKPYTYNVDYPHLQESIRRFNKLPYVVHKAIRALMEVYFPLRLTPGANVLDVGCEMGQLGHLLKLGGVKMTGIDINIDALREGRRLFGVEKNNFTLQAQASCLPFEDNAFDAVMSEDLLEHLEGENAARASFKEMERVCGGPRMLHKVTVLEDHDWIDADPSHRIKWTATEWTEWFRDLGWKVTLPTDRTYPAVNKKGVHFYNMHGYFLIERDLNFPKYTLS